MIAVAAGIALVLLVQTYALWRLARRLRRLPVRDAMISQIDERLVTLSNALTLLTDTTEACFQSLGSQLVDTAARPRPGEPATTQRRIVSAVRRGGSVGDIAAREKVAESEVRLRLSLREEQTAQEDPWA